EGAWDLGIYGAVAKIAVFLNLFITAFRLGAEAFFFSYAKNENSGKVYAKIMDYFIVAMVLVMVGLCANIEWLKYFIKGGEFQKDIYWSGLYIVPILLLNNVLLGIYMNLSIWYKLSDQTKYGLYISSVGAMITIVLNILFIPKFSYLGAALSTTVTYCVMVAMSYFMGQKHYPIPYDVQKNVSYIAVAVGVSAIMFYVFDKNLWLCNLLFVLMLGGVAYSERKFILSLMARRK